MMPGMDSMMAPMMHVMAFTPEHLLREKTTLHLTADQQAELTTLRDAAKAAHDAAAQQAAMHMREMEQAMDVAAPDTSAAKPHFDAAHRFMGEAMWAMVRSAAQARALAHRRAAEAGGRHGGAPDAGRRDDAALGRAPLPEATRPALDRARASVQLGLAISSRS